MLDALLSVHARGESGGAGWVAIATAVAVTEALDRADTALLADRPVVRTVGVHLARYIGPIGRIVIVRYIVAGQIVAGCGRTAPTIVARTEQHADAP